MKKISKLFALSLAILLVFSLTSCKKDDAPSGGVTPSNNTSSNNNTDTTPDAGTTTDDPPVVSTDPGTESSGGGKVGVSMPTKSLQRWNEDGAYLETNLKAAGYEVDLQYAGDNDVPTQINQLENMIASGVEVLIIAAIEGDSLTEVLASAKEKGISVIAYDRLIMGTDAVSYYATFDNLKVGTVQGNWIVDKLDLKNADGPFNIEFFTGDPGDNNIHFFFGGAMEVLQPYLDNGKLVCPSGQTDIMQVATLAWSSANSQERMENLITSNGYGPDGTPLHAVMCSNDSTAQGVTTALVNAGYDSSNFPIVTGQDCDIISVKNMIAGTQSMSVFKDTRTLAAKVVEMVQAIMGGSEPPINDRETYDNGTGVIPSFLCDPVEGTVDNYVALLIDTGYYDASEFDS